MLDAMKYIKPCTQQSVRRWDYKHFFVSNFCFCHIAQALLI